MTLVCPRCKYEAKTRHILMRHWKRKYPCKPLFCNTPVESLLLKEEGIFVCNYCDKQFKQEIRLVTHKESCLHKAVFCLKEELTKAKSVANVVVPPSTLANKSESPAPDQRQGYIYLLREREALNSHQPVYKVGMTCQLPNTRFRRLEDYKKGSEVLIVMRVMDIKQTVAVETSIKLRFSKLFVRHMDGNEYFYGCGITMQHIVTEEVNMANSVYMNTQHTSD